MQYRSFPNAPLPAKNQQVNVTLSNGRTYSICSKGQYAYIKHSMFDRFMMQAALDGAPISEAEALKRTEKWMETECKYAYLEAILAKMTAHEREQWNAQYRFGGISTKIPD